MDMDMESVVLVPSAHGDGVVPVPDLPKCSSRSHTSSWVALPMARRALPLSGDQFVARAQAAAASTPDDGSITRDGKRLDTEDAVLTWLAEVEAERAAGRYVEFDDSEPPAST